MNDEIARVLDNCDCILRKRPTDHPKVAVRPPSAQVMMRISLDVICLEGKHFPHSVDEYSTWSEAGRIPSKSMDYQISTFSRMHLWRHGAPQAIRCDNECNNHEFRNFCLEEGITLAPVEANDHEANGLIENANKTLRSFFNRTRLCDKRSTCEAIVARALYGKNHARGSKLASAYELLFQRRLPLLIKLDRRLPRLPKVEENARRTAHRRLRKILRTPRLKTNKFLVGDKVAIYRDGSGLLAPCRITRL